MTKEEILAEIQRTAADNGDKPLGSRRFREVTGISEYEWGRYWPRFADAQREAGFEANERNAALDPELVIEKYIGLVRELGKIPTYSELRVQRSRDPQFPDGKTFYRAGNRAGGGKNALVGRVLEYARAKSGYEDVVAICEAGYQPDPSGGRSDSGDDGSVTVGFVYLAKGQRGQYKLGRTNLVDRRVSELGATMPVELELVHDIKTDDPAGVEVYWHKRFADRRLKGEWFKSPRAISRRSSAGGESSSASRRNCEPERVDVRMGGARGHRDDWPGRRNVPHCEADEDPRGEDGGHRLGD
jgi:hypothetical protein